METYCRMSGLPFSEQMLEWEAKEFPEWTTCPYYQAWHGQVIASKGFEKRDKPEMNVTCLLPELQDAIQRATPFFKQLHSRKFHF